VRVSKAASGRWRPLRIAVLACLLGSGLALGENPLRRAGVTTGTAGAPVDPAVAANQAQAQAAALARQAESPLRRALDAVRAFQASQLAARSAAQSLPGSVPNGVGTGALDIDPSGPRIGATLQTPTIEAGRTEVTVTQDSERAVLTWRTFNVGSQTDLYFDQRAGGDSASNWAILNRVNDPGARPSQILGSIKSEGQVYVINRNGVVFGGTAQINVGTLVVSGLDIAGTLAGQPITTDAQRNARFLQGTLYDLTLAGTGNVTVERGADLAAPGGRIALFGLQVVNSGTLEAPDGQVFLAAGSSAQLQPPQDLSAIRGLRPPIASPGGSAQVPPSYTVVSGDGVADNEGLISTPRGNITLVGGLTAQNGMLSATTGAQANGSIVVGADGFVTTFGTGSVTQILPDVGGKKVIGTVDFKPSNVQILGDQIILYSGASVYVPGGQVSLSAVMSSQDPLRPGVDDTRIYVAPDARVDVSGLQDVEIAMAQNSIKAELRANELRDNPLLRDNPAIRSKTIYFDGRLGVNPGVADVSGYYDLVEHDVTELMTAGGSVTLRANEIILRKGSTIDLSGGSLKYLDGYIRESVLVDPSGKRVPIDRAVPGVAYVGIGDAFQVIHERWGVTETFSAPLTGAAAQFVPGYTQGASAGSLSLGTNAPNWFAPPADRPRPASPSASGAVRILEGSVVATTVVGPNQTALPTGSTDPTKVWQERPQGATLALSNAADVMIGGAPAPLADGFGPATSVDPSLRYRMQLPASWFDGHTFQKVTIASGFDPDEVAQGNQARGDSNRAPGGHLTIGQGVVVNLGDGGAFTFSGKSAEIAGTILAPGGRVSLLADQLETPDSSEAGRVPTVHLGSTGSIDLAGRLVQAGQPGDSLATSGGTVSLAGSRLLLDPGSSLDVSGGATIDPTGTKVTAGAAGSIALDVTRTPRPEGGSPSDPLPTYSGTLVLGGSLRGYGLARGGTLTLVTGDDLFLGSSVPSNDTSSTARLIVPAFFRSGGFSSYGLTGRTVTIGDGVVLAPSAELLVLPANPSGASGSVPLDVLAARAEPDPRFRPAGQLKLGSLTGDIVVGAGAEVHLAPGSTLQLTSARSVRLDGTIDIPGGTVALTTVSGDLTLGATSSILVPGYARETLTSGNVIRRSIEAGGTVTLTVAGGDLRIVPGATIDASGMQGMADLLAGGGTGASRYEAVPVDGDAGSITVLAPGGLVSGNLRLEAGGSAGRGGSLVVDASRSNGTLTVVPSDSSAGPPGGFTVVADSINRSGADEVTLQVVGPDSTSFGNTNAVVFDGNVSLRSGRSLTLLSPILGTTGPGAQVTLSSPYVLLQGSDRPSDPASTVVANDLGSTLKVQADLIDVVKLVLLGCTSSIGCNFGGFGVARLESSGDIRLADHDDLGNQTKFGAGLLSPGVLELSAAQVYVASRLLAGANVERPSDDPGFVVHSDVRVTVLGNGNPAPVPLSFGERLTIEAPVVEQKGVLRAPQGQIRLVGLGPDGSVTLDPGSITSASLGGQEALFGSLRTGGDFFGYSGAGQAPSKSIEVRAPRVAVEQGAVVDVSGGGDLLGYQFVPGNGGSKDVLASSTGFAILPSLGTAPLPIGGVGAARNPTLEVGDRVWLQGMPGLKDGWYTLLPAHYALLPGGLFVQPLTSGLAEARPSYVRPDGATVVSGRLSRAVQPGFAQFVVMPRSVFGKYSQLDTSSFNAYASALAAEAGVGVRTPNDAGSVVLAASTELTLRGTGQFGAPTGGLLGDLDISSPRIAVLSAGHQAPDPSYITIDPAALDAFGAGSILLGGTRSSGTSSTGTTVTTVSVNSTDVLISTAGGTTWTGPEILIAATSSITIADGSLLEARGATALGARPLLLSTDSGAMVRLSTGDRVPLLRPGTATGSGDLNIGAATLSALGSLSLDGASNIGLSPASVVTTPQLDIASARVNLGDAPVGTPGVTLGGTKLAALATSSDLLLRGYQSIQIYGSVVLGGADSHGDPTLRTLTLDSASIVGQGNAGETARLMAGTLTLQNSGGATGGGASSGGTLSLDVGTLELGYGPVQISGFGALGGTVGDLRLVGTGSLAFTGGVSLAVGRVSAAGGASYALSVDGSLALTHGSRSGDPGVEPGLGGRLILGARDLTLDTTVSLPSGVFQAVATAGSIQVGSDARIDLRGTQVPFDDVTRDAPGGTIQLQASGPISLLSGSVLDVSGSSTGSAGTIFITSGGQASLAGDLRGAGGSAGRGGSLFLDAGSTESDAAFLTLLGKLGSGGFDDTVSLRLRTQDLLVPAGSTLKAHQVVLWTELGSVTLAGSIDASGATSGGSIEVVGGAGLGVLGSARLDAHGATGEAGTAGRIELAATGGRLDVAPGAAMDVSGGASGGLVVFRAQRVGAGDVAVDRLVGSFTGAREVVVQGLKDYAATTVDAGEALLVLSEGSAWMQASDAGARARLLGLNPSLTNLRLAPAIQIVSAGDLDVTAPVNLSTLAAGSSAPGFLGLTAAGNLGVRATISDGFDGPDRSATLLTGESSSIALEAGGDVSLAAGAMVRTGTGQISVQAGRDLIFAGSPSVTPAVIYTAGRRTGTPGFGGSPTAGEFPTEGGEVLVRAGRDILAPLASQAMSAWLFRSGAVDATGKVLSQTSWSVVYASFEQSLGALGGGDIAVRAGRDVRQLQVAIPTTGFVTTPVGSVPSAGDLVVRGGGDLYLSAAGDIRGGLYMLGRGLGEVLAGGAVLPSDTKVGLRTSPGTQTLGLPQAVGLLIGVGDAVVKVTAGSSAYLEGVFDPLQEAQAAQNLGGAAQGTAFQSYTDRTAVEVSGLSGNVSFENNPWASVDLTLAPGGRYSLQMTGAGSDSLNTLFGNAPPTLRLSALSSSVIVEDRFNHLSDLNLTAAPRGTLEILAAEDTRLSVRAISLIDVTSQYRRDALDPLSTTGDKLTNQAPSDLSNNLQRGTTPLHAGDADPVRIYALGGTVCAVSTGQCQTGQGANIFGRETRITLPKPLRVVAGQDIFRGLFFPQGNSDGDASEFVAGRDIVDPVVEARGVGSVLLQAGRDIVLDQTSLNDPSFGGTLVALADRTDLSRQNSNTALPANRAASFYLLAGAKNGADYQGFAAAYLDPANSEGVVRTYLPELEQYMATLGISGLGDQELVARFQALPARQRQVFVDQIFLEELKQTGIDYNDPTSPRFQSYTRGFRAVELLFPPNPATLDTRGRGSVILNAKAVETQSQGDINILAPYGSIEVGTDVVTGNVDPAAGGAVTRRGGNIRMMSDQNIDLFTSRVFTLQGGDILMWTSNGSITAGTGSKTSVFQKPLAYLLSPAASVSVDAFGLATGAGIGVLDALQNASSRKRSRLDLIAPRGEINAGDAGIRVVGDINLAAAVVVGVENIQFSGKEAGVPKVEVPNISALTSASQLSQAASQQGVGPEARPRTSVADLPSIITVEVLGYETPTPTEGQDRRKGKGAK